MELTKNLSSLSESQHPCAKPQTISWQIIKKIIKMANEATLCTYRWEIQESAEGRKERLQGKHERGEMGKQKVWKRKWLC